MKKSDVLKTFRKVNEATTDGFLPSENTHLVNKQYVDDILVEQITSSEESIKEYADSKYAPLDSPNFTTAISMGRSNGSTVGLNSIALGNSVIASQEYSFAQGIGTTASGPNSHAEGFGSTASGNTSHAEGYNTTASGEYSHTEGSLTEASGSNSHAEGGGSKAKGVNSHAEGGGSKAEGDYSHAEGNSTTASGKYSHAEGKDTKALQDYSHAEGGSSIASGPYSHAEGSSSTSSSYASHAEGSWTTASGFGSHAEGKSTKALSPQSHAEGEGTQASSENQHVQGKYNIEDTAGTYAHIIGNGTSSTRSNAHTVDWYGNAWYQGNVSIDGTPSADKDLTTKKYVDDKVASLVDSAPETLDTLKELSTALGDDPNFATTMATTLGNKVDKVDGKALSTNDLTDELKANYDVAYTHSQSAHFDGNYNSLTNIPTDLVKTSDADSKYAPIDSPNFTTAISMGRANGNTIGTNSVALGTNVVAAGENSHAEGAGTVASGDYSHAEGSGNTAAGENSHAEGNGTVASGKYSHAEGAGTKAESFYSHAEGGGSTALGVASHSEGEGTKASGRCSHAEGGGTVASGDYSHAEGYEVKASSEYQHVQGRDNIEDTSRRYAHIVGNGTSDTVRSNAHTLDWNGNAWYQGNIYTGGTGQDDSNAKKLATEEFVNNNKVTKTSELTNDSGFTTEEALFSIVNYIDENISDSTPTITYKDCNAYIFNKIDLSSIINNLKIDIKASDMLTPVITYSNFVYDESMEAYYASLNYNNVIDDADRIYITTNDNNTIIVYSTEISYAGLWTHVKVYTKNEKYASIDYVNNNKFSGSYNDLTDKPTIPSIEGLATESYVDNKLASEEIIFEGNENNPLVLHGYYTHVPIADGAGFLVIDKTLEINSTYNPYTIEISGCQPRTLDGRYSPDTSTFNSTYNMWVYDLGDGYKFQMGNIDYNGSPALAVAWDDAGNYSNLKITKRVDLMNIINNKADKKYVYDSISSIAIPTKVSELTNDIGFITSIPDEYITETELTAKNYIDNTTLESKGYLTEHQDLSSYALKTDLHTHANKAILDAITDAKITEWNSKSTFSGNYNDLTNKPTIPAAYTHPSTHPASMITGLATVATSGSYNDLANKPTIPTVSNDLTNALKANYDAAYTHSQSAHAPSNAQKNSDITKAEIEAKLTGDITTHTHSQYLTEHQSLEGLATQTYVDNKISTSINNTRFKSTYASSDWVLNDTTSLYELTVTHNLNTSDITVFARNSTVNYDMFIDYEVTDNNNIKIISDEAPETSSIKVLAF